MQEASDVLTDRFRNSQQYAALKVVNGGALSEKKVQADIFSAIAMGDEGQKLGDRLSEILDKVFGKMNTRYDLKSLSFPEVSCLSNFLAVSTKIFMSEDECEVVGLKCFILKFHKTDRFRLLNLATNDKLGSPELARGIRDILMLSC